MSAGSPVEGAGCITWWGLSPALDLIDTAPGAFGQQAEVSILLMGSGDLRHLLKTVAGQAGGPVLHFYVVENSLELIARHLLLLSLALEPPSRMGLQEKVELFLELYGNSLIRSQTAQYLSERSTDLIHFLSGMETGPRTLLPNVDITALKYKERDQLEGVCQFWRGSSSFPVGRLWDARVRQHLGSRFDSRMGAFDWDLALKLHHKGASLISKQQYVRWREQGVAFEMREGIYGSANRSLASGRVFRHKGDRVPVRGYWGDIVTSPYISFGIQTDEPSLLKTLNGQHTKTAQDVSYHTVQTLFQALASRSVCDPDEQTSVAQRDGTMEGEESSTGRGANRKTPDYALLLLDRVKVTLLPVDSVSRLHEKQSFRQRFHIIYCSCSVVHQLGATLRPIAAPGASLVVELAKYILDLSREQETGFAERVADIAREAGFEPAGQKSDVIATFRLRDPEPARGM